MADKSKRSSVGAEYAMSLKGVGIVANSFTPPAAMEWDDGEGMIGRRFLDNDRSTKNKKDLTMSVGGNFTFAQLKAIHWAIMFPETGGAGAGFFTGFTKKDLDSDPPDVTNQFDLVADYLSASGKVFTWADCFMNMLEIEAPESAPLEVVAEIFGTVEKSEDTASVTAATGATLAHTTDTQLDMGANTYFPKGVKFTINQQLVVDWLNSITPVVTSADIQIVEGELTMTLNTDVWADLLSKLDTNNEISLSWKAESGSDGVGLELPTIKFTGPMPTLPKEGQVTHTLPFRSFGTTAAAVVQAYTK